jgi:N-acetylated-alpha-linked acidic dipeptidase
MKKDFWSKRQILNYPFDKAVEMIDDDGHVVWSANLEEVADESDPDAYKASGAAPVYCAHSPNGDVTGNLVYAHYARYQDFAELIAKGVDLKGAIVIARYGGISRGLKVRADWLEVW